MNTFAVITLLSCVAIALAIEEPSFTVADEYDGFEVRDYDASVAVETCGRGRYSFMYLAQYIGVQSTPANSRQEKIDMTAPVVNYMNQDDDMCMQFILPQSVYGDDVTSAPAPTMQEVAVVARPEMTMAYVNFYGWANSNVYTNRLRRLQAAIEARMEEDPDFGYQIAEPVYMEGNGYSGPWVWGPFRKNGVGIQLERVPTSDEE